MPNQLAVLSTKSTRTLQEIPIPEPGPGEILIKNVAVASNPKDYKFPTRIEGYNAVEGNDVAGTIVAIGEGVTEFKVGDRVASISKGGTTLNKYGAYAEYTVSFEKTSFHLGPNVSYEAASTISLAYITAAIGLFIILGLPEPPESGFAPASGQGIIVYGASTSLGSYVIQLAKRAGFFVIGVAGASTAYAETLGADVIINYKKEADLEAALISAAGNHPISYAYDTISLNKSTLLLGRVLAKTSPTKKGKVVYAGMPTEEEITLIPAGIDSERVWGTTAHGKDIEFAAKFFRMVGKWLQDGSFKANNVRIIPNGLEGVDLGLTMLMNGEVHAEKLVYRIADTPGLKA